MSFELKNYQRLMNKMFAHQIERNVQVYVDDMMVKSIREDYHLNDLEETFDILRSYNMKLNPSKCAFGARQENSWVSWYPKRVLRLTQIRYKP